MEKLAFDLVLNEKKSKYDVALSEKVFYVGLGGSIIIFAINWALKKYIGIAVLDLQLIKYLVYGLLACIAIGSLYVFFDFNGNNRIIKGFITFDENKITINHVKRYNLTEIKNLNFNISDYKGRFINPNTYGDPTQSYGGENFVEFNYRNKKHKYQFVANSEKHKDTLIKKLIPKMKNKTNIKY